MTNNFQQWPEGQGSDEFEGMAEIENKLVKQAETFSFFGKVVELFIPNALQTVTTMIGGEGANNKPRGKWRKSPETGSSDWRVPPGRA